MVVKLFLTAEAFASANIFNMKKNTILTLFLILILCSCDSSVTQETALIADTEITSFLCIGEDVCLEISAVEGIGDFDSVQWYETDKSRSVFNSIDGATSTEFVVEAFDTEEVKYFICKVEKDGKTETSEVFSIAYTGLPVVSISTDGSEINREDWLEAGIEIDGSALTGKIKGRGNSSWHFNKKSFSLKLDEKTDILGMPKHKRWVLIGNSIDGSLLRNYFASYLGNSVFTGDEWNPSFVFVDLVMDGVYWGNYILGEQIKISGKRVDIEDISEVGIGNGGFIVEVNIWKDEEFNFVTSRSIPISLKEPDEVSEEIQQFVKTTIQNAEDALFSDSFADEETGYAKYFDVESVIDWYLVNEITANYDAIFRTSVYMYYDNTDGKIHMGPNWDFDRSAGMSPIRVNQWHVRNSPWMRRFFEDSAFEAAVIQRYNEKRDELYEAVNTMISEMADSISISAQLNNSRWKVLADYQTSVETLQEWLNQRLQWLDEQWL